VALTTEFVSDEAELSPHIAGWKQLATAAGQPLCLPGWMLAWWRHMRPLRSRLAVILVRDDTELVGVAPYFVQRRRVARSDYRLLASGTSHRIGLVAAPGRESEVAAAVSRALAVVRPRPSAVTFEGVDATTTATAAMATAWPGRLRPYERLVGLVAAPVLAFDAPDFDAWMASKSSNFRQWARRGRRRLAQRGLEVVEATNLDAAIDAFARLHRDRWRGGSSLDVARTRAMLTEVARAGDGALRLWCVLEGERFVAVQVVMAAGGELAYWNGGWDAEYAEYRPGAFALLAAIEDGFTRGDRRFDFGGGDSAYKRRFATANEPIAWSVLVPAGVRHPLTRLELLPSRASAAARALTNRLPKPASSPAS
jgi:CelD/BcsL family acetyltransferase involved in cellulose biosynthesis